MKKMMILFFAIIATSNAVVNEKIVNLSSMKTIYDVEIDGKYVWIATSGGLIRSDYATSENLIRPSNAEFPDPVIKSLTLDNQGNVWAGSIDGYLLKTDKNGNEQINTSYNSASWKIHDMIPYGPYLIVGTDKGVSLFDTRKNSVIKNAAQLASMTSSQVHVLSVYKNRLYVGCELGLAWLDTTIKVIDKLNFYDPSIWKVDTSVHFPVHSLVADSTGIHPYEIPAARFNGRLLTAENNKVKLAADPPVELYMQSKVTFLKVFNDIKCWIGTAGDYYQILDNTLTPIYLGGPAFTGVNRLHVDRTGKLWILPYGLGTGENNLLSFINWWVGIGTYHGTEWKTYSPKDFPRMGHMGLSPNAFGIMEAKDGSMWFGFEGGSIKRFDPNIQNPKKQWSLYCNFGQGQGNGAFLKSNDSLCPDSDYGKCDAIAQDSAGFIWFGSWNNLAGSLLCYKPTTDESDSLPDNLKGKFRRFPPYGSLNPPLTEINAIAADRTKNILFGTSKGIFTVVTYDTDPITDSIRVVKEFQGLQNIYKIVVLPDNTSLVLSSAGVYQFDPDKLELVFLEKMDKNITSLCLENEYIYWYATSNEGLVRYDLKTEGKTYFTKADGLISNKINDIVVDQKNGYVWVATDRGISQLSLGYNKTSNEKKMEIVYPNPFSLSKHTVLYFQNMPAASELRIYTLDGNLVGKPVAVRNSDAGSYFQWQPPKKCSPGTYFYAIKKKTGSTTGKLLFVP